MPGKLWENTREWHHKCESHPVGASMAAGNPHKDDYADWLMTLFFIHLKIDPHMEDCAWKTKAILKDIESNEVIPKAPISVIKWFNEDLDENQIGGFSYVLTGAHLMGGEIMRRRLQGYPTSHLEWNDRKEALAYLQTLRDREEFTVGALQCFELLYNAMEEIHHVNQH